jgi:hypothetical protein
MVTIKINITVTTTRQFSRQLNRCTTSQQYAVHKWWKIVPIPQQRTPIYMARHGQSTASTQTTIKGQDVVNRQQKSINVKATRFATY